MRKLIPFTLLAATLCSAEQSSQTAGPLEVRQEVRIQPLGETVIPPRIGVVGQMSLTLPDVIQRVLANDPDLEISRIQLEEADYNVTGAKGFYDPVFGVLAQHSRAVTPIASIIGGSANGKLTNKEWDLNPSVSGSSPWLGGSYSMTFNNSQTITDSTFTTLNPQYPASVSLNLTQPLWRGLHFDTGRYQLQVARKNVGLSREQLRQQVIAVVTQAILYYWELDYAAHNLDVQAEAVRLAQQQYESNRRQAEQGILAPVDVVAAQTQVATFQQNLFLAQQALTAAENNLKTLMLPGRTDPLWGVALVPETQPDPNVVPPTLSEAVQQALASRPELSENLINLEINRLTLKQTDEATKPQINAVATLTTTGLAGAPHPFQSVSIPGFNFGSGTLPPILIGNYGDSLSNILGGNFTTAKVGVQVSLPLHNRTAEANLAVSMAEKRRLEVVRNQLGMAIEADVRNALQAVNSARARYEAAMLASRSADEQYTSEQRQFQAGTSTVFLVLQRQTDLITARSREIRARADFAESVAGLDRATARTIEAHQITLTP
ncbi:MAG TPA: TolC family protein [Bryobacteraceae bacterium]|nr:TolC family protein [Bryobacteraceae bacterium]